MNNYMDRVSLDIEGEEIVINYDFDENYNGKIIVGEETLEKIDNVIYSNGERVATISYSDVVASDYAVQENVLPFEPQPRFGWTFSERAPTASGEDVGYSTVPTTTRKVHIAFENFINNLTVAVIAGVIFGAALPILGLAASVATVIKDFIVGDRHNSYDKNVHYYYAARTNGEEVYVDTETFFAYWG